MGIHMVNEEKLRIMVNLARYEQEPLHTELVITGSTIFVLICW